MMQISQTKVTTQKFNINPASITNAQIDQLDKTSLLAVIQEQQKEFFEISANILSGGAASQMIDLGFHGLPDNDETKDKKDAYKQQNLDRLSQVLMDGLTHNSDVDITVSCYVPATVTVTVKAEEFVSPQYTSPGLSAVDIDSLKRVVKTLRDCGYDWVDSQYVVINEVKDFNKLPREELPARPAF